MLLLSFSQPVTQVLLPALHQDLASSSKHRAASVPHFSSTRSLFPQSAKNWQQSLFGYLFGTNTAENTEVKQLQS